MLCLSPTSQFAMGMPSPEKTRVPSAIHLPVVCSDIFISSLDLYKSSGSKYLLPFPGCDGKGLQRTGQRVMRELEGDWSRSTFHASHPPCSAQNGKRNLLFCSSKRLTCAVKRVLWDITIRRPFRAFRAKANLPGIASHSHRFANAFLGSQTDRLHETCTIAFSWRMKLRPELSGSG